ncbi:hypothetical protein N2152v2_006302 [Parachlorella kessleri]
MKVVALLLLSVCYVAHADSGSRKLRQVAIANALADAFAGSGVALANADAAALATGGSAAATAVANAIAGAPVIKIPAPIKVVAKKPSPPPVCEDDVLDNCCVDEVVASGVCEFTTPVTVLTKSGPATVDKDNTYKLSAISPAAWTSDEDDSDTCVCPTVVPKPPAKKKPVVVAVPTPPPIEITFPIKPIKVVPAPPPPAPTPVATAIANAQAAATATGGK